MAHRSATLTIVPTRLADALRVAFTVTPRGEGQLTAQRELIASLQSALEARRQRIILSRSSLNWVKWTALLLQAGLTLLTIAMVHSDNRATNRIILTIFATGIGTAIVLIASHTRPFTGEIAVQPSVLLQVMPEAGPGPPQPEWTSPFPSTGEQRIDTPRAPTGEHEVQIEAAGSTIGCSAPDSTRQPLAPSRGGSRLEHRQLEERRVTDTGSHLAQVNIGRARGEMTDPVMAEFVARLPEINALADASPGFIWRLQTEDGDATAVRPYDDASILINLSVWTDLAALRAYVFRSDHAAVMRRRREWFERFDRVYVALWWVPAGHHPAVAEAVARLAHLNNTGLRHSRSASRRRSAPTVYQSHARASRRATPAPPPRHPIERLVLLDLLATACAGLFAGAAAYISLVEHPARLECGTELAVTQFAPSYRRATVMQASLAAAGLLAALAAWAQGRGTAVLAGGLLLGAVIPFTLLIILPTNKRLLAPDLDRRSPEAAALLRRWGRLHAVRTMSSAIGVRRAALAPRAGSLTGSRTSACFEFSKPRRRQDGPVLQTDVASRYLRPPTASHIPLIRSHFHQRTRLTRHVSSASAVAEQVSASCALRIHT